MAHRLIVGMTESGKTTLAKMLSFGLKNKGEIVAVLDPLNDEGWACDFQTQNPEKFLEYARSVKSAYLFVDEGSVSIGRYNDEMQWLATLSRHWGHSCYFISQGVVQLAPIVRQQCSQYFVFACGESNTSLIAEECREPMLKNASKIGPGEFYKISRFSEPLFGRITVPSNQKLGDGKRYPLDKLSVAWYRVGGTPSPTREKPDTPPTPQEKAYAQNEQENGADFSLSDSTVPIDT